MAETEQEVGEETRLILGVPGVGVGRLARSSVEWLLAEAIGLAAAPGFRAELGHWLERPLPGPYFGVISVRDDELALFKTIVQRAGWAYGSPDDVKRLQLAVARAAGGVRPSGY